MENVVYRRLASEDESERFSLRATEALFLSQTFSRKKTYCTSATYDAVCADSHSFFSKANGSIGARGNSTALFAARDLLRDPVLSSSLPSLEALLLPARLHQHLESYCKLE